MFGEKLKALKNIDHFSATFENLFWPCRVLLSCAKITKVLDPWTLVSCDGILEGRTQELVVTKTQKGNKCGGLVVTNTKYHH
jgi:hypothetical protein